MLLYFAVCTGYLIQLEYKVRQGPYLKRYMSGACPSVKIHIDTINGYSADQRPNIQLGILPETAKLCTQVYSRAAHAYHSHDIVCKYFIMI